MAQAETNAWLHLPGDYVSRSKPDYFNDISNRAGNVIYQPDVYAFADFLLRTSGRGTLLDVGCGSARKLLATCARRTIGVDFATNVQSCRQEWPDRDWIELDLESGTLPAVAGLDLRDAVVVNSDVIEHLVDPTNLISQLRALYDGGAIVLISTPDRCRSRGINHKGPPGNPAHVREWALPELAALLAERGLPATFAGYTINNTRRFTRATLLTIHDRELNAALKVTQVQEAGPAPLAFLKAREADSGFAMQRDILKRQGVEVRPATPGALEAAVADEPGRWVIELADNLVPCSMWPGLTVAQSLAVLSASGFDELRLVAVHTTEAMSLQDLPQRASFTGRRSQLRLPTWTKGPGQAARPASVRGHCLVYRSEPGPAPAIKVQPWWKRLRDQAHDWMQGYEEPIAPASFLEDYVVERLSDVSSARVSFLKRL